MRTLLLAAGLASMALSGCASSLHGIMATDEQSVWVVSEDAVYRCTDTAARGTAPRPTCVRAPMQSTASGSPAPATTTAP
jgi:hypothetical protein